MNTFFLSSLVAFQQSSQDNGQTTNNVISGACMVTILILFLGLYYKISLEKTQNYRKLPKLIFLVFLFIRWVKKTTIELLGRRYSFAIPFFIYIVFYFWGSSLVGMLGFNGTSAFAYVPLSVSGVVFLGTIVSGVMAKGWGFCKDYYVWLKLGKRKILPVPDVLKVLGEAGKVVSLGLRLWGNYFAGAIVLFMIKHFLGSTISSSLPGHGIATTLWVFPLHLYFDVIDGALHSMIFLLLTMSYWSIAKQIEHKK